MMTPNSFSRRGRAQGIDGVQAESLAEEGGIVLDHLRGHVFEFQSLYNELFDLFDQGIIELDHSFPLLKKGMRD